MSAAPVAAFARALGLAAMAAGLVLALTEPAPSSAARLAQLEIDGDPAQLARR